ncbi:GNAT family N-acetyltransferase [Mycobacteroides abscessus]|uniref:GNAT family N-acetyltransferase n=1 Tax=Mycobacteroides abscessus TaxID=36809 RepID=UPI000E6924FB|nr:GNAT family N-acetyltransferase [Mycobacteroides abscessus]RIS84077.1 N-acetyltransferase [Mycobacteroides abscessus]
MDVELAEVPYRRDALPFDHRRDGYTFDWRNAMRDPSAAAYYQVLLDGTEVARLETDEKVYLERYGDASRFEDTALEVQNFDVHEDYRRQGIGRAAIEQLARMFPDRRLVALSNDDESDKFWGCGMGWRRFDNIDGRSRPAYVQSS